MSASMQPMYSSAPAALPFCYEFVQIAANGLPDGDGGFMPANAAALARADFLSRLASFESANMDHVAATPPSGGGPFITDTLTRPIWSGLGTIATDNRFAFAYIGDTASGAQFFGRFNTTAGQTSGNWLDGNLPINITLSSPRNAFCCYFTDYGDFDATLDFEFYLGATLVKSISIPPPNLALGDPWHIGYFNGAILFDKIRFNIANTTDDYVGFDDLVIGMTPECITPDCFEQLVMVKQNQLFGGAPTGDGMVQSGPAVNARAEFLAGLQSYLTEDFNSLTATTTNYWDDILPLWGGAGTIQGKDYAGAGETFYINSPPLGLNGRFNTSANASGNWCETAAGWEIVLPTEKTAFGCYVMDLGDVRQGELEFRIYNGTVLLRVLALPTIDIDKPRSDQAMWVGYADGNRPFNRIECHVRQYSINPSQRDFVGFDDMAIGDVVTCVPDTLPVVHYGANTTGDSAKTVTGAAQTARDSWAAAVIGAPHVCDFEAASLGVVALNTAFSFSDGATSFNAYFFPVQYTATHTLPADISADAIDNNGAALRWNTTPGGSKWYELNDELTIVLLEQRTSFGFYVTDLGNQNATLRVTFRRANGSGVSYYLPKATTLPGAASLLRFWGVTDELPFTSVVLQTVYYSDLTANVYNNPVSHVVSPRDVVGIDDIMVA